jgi:hypothetical protein
MIAYIYANHEPTVEIVANAIEDAGGKVFVISDSTHAKFCVWYRCMADARRQIETAAATALATRRKP